MKNAFFLLVLSIGLVPAPARSGEPPDSRALKEIGLSVPRGLREKGIRKIGRLDLGEMLERFEALRVVGWVRPFAEREPAEGGRPAGFEGQRRSGRYDRGGSVYVYVGDGSPADFGSPAFRLLVLHEMLGGANYFDRNYNLAIALFRLDQESDGLTRARDLDVFDRLYALPFEPLLAAAREGGGGGIGAGGGDVEGAALKYALVSEFDAVAALTYPPYRGILRDWRATLLARLLVDVMIELVDDRPGAPTVEARPDGSVLVLRRAWDAARGANRRILLARILEKAVDASGIGARL